MEPEKSPMSAPVHAIAKQLGLDLPLCATNYYQSGQWKEDGLSPEILAEDCVVMFTCIERLSRMMMHSHFLSLHKHHDHWSISYKSSDGVSTGEISNSDFMCLLWTWEEIAKSLEVHEQT